MLAAIFRFLLFPLITFRPTYLMGMVLVRFSRKLKARSQSSEREFVTIPNFMGRIRMRVDKNSYMGGSIYWCGFHHINELLFLRSFLKKEMVFADVGANQGEFALYAASKLSKGKVLAFEPTPYQLGLLKENIKLNQYSNIDVLEFGLFDKETELEVYTTYEVERHGGVNEGLSSLYKSEERSEVEAVIKLKVFDELYLDKLGRLDVVKIDVEGAELSVMKGMQGSLIKFKPLLLVEMNSKTFEDAGYRMEDVLHFLTDLDYIPYKLFRGRLQDFDRTDMAQFSNVVFTHKSNDQSQH